MPKVLMAPMTLVHVEGPYRQVLRDAGFELVYPAGAGHQLVEDQLFEALGDCQAALAGSEPYTSRVLAAHPKLRVIARVGVGYDAVDVPAATSPCCSAWPATSCRNTSASRPGAGRARRRCRSAGRRSESPASAASARPSPSAARRSA